MMYATTTPNMRKCPTCNGTGINPLAYWMVCPKCKGEKWLPRGR